MWLSESFERSLFPNARNDQNNRKNDKNSSRKAHSETHDERNVRRASLNITYGQTNSKIRVSDGRRETFKKMTYLGVELSKQIPRLCNRLLR